MSEVDNIYFSRFAQIKGQSFDYIVIGGGAYGTSFTHRVLQHNPQARILVLEKGNYLIPDHIQNIPPAYIKLNTSVGIRAMDLPWICRYETQP